MSTRRSFVAVVLFVLNRRRTLSYSTGQISIYYFAVILILTSLAEVRYFICAARVALPGLHKPTSKCQVRCTCQPNFFVDRNFLLYFWIYKKGNWILGHCILTTRLLFQILVSYCSDVFAKDDRTLQSALLYTTTKRFEVTKSNWNDLFMVHIGFITQGVLLWRNILGRVGGCTALLVNY